MAAGLLLRVHKIPVDLHLEDAATGRSDLQRADRVLVLLKQIGRQTDGSVGVASDGAISDADLHCLLFGGGGKVVDEGYRSRRCTDTLGACRDAPVSWILLLRLSRATEEAVAGHGW
jgi:hypothetical protein